MPCEAGRWDLWDVPCQMAKQRVMAGLKWPPLTGAQVCEGAAYVSRSRSTGDLKCSRKLDLLALPVKVGRLTIMANEIPMAKAHPI